MSGDAEARAIARFGMSPQAESQAALALNRRDATIRNQRLEIAALRTEIEALQKLLGAAVAAPAEFERAAAERMRERAAQWHKDMAAEYFHAGNASSAERHLRYAAAIDALPLDPEQKPTSYREVYGILRDPEQTT